MKIPSLKVVTILFLWATAGVLCFGNEGEVVVSEHYFHQNPYEEEKQILQNPHIIRDTELDFRRELPAELVIQSPFIDSGGGVEEEPRIFPATIHSDIATPELRGWFLYALAGASFALSRGADHFFGLNMGYWGEIGWVAGVTALLDGLIMRNSRSPEIIAERSDDTPYLEWKLTRSQKKAVTDILSGTPRILDEEGTLGYAKKVRIETDFSGAATRVAADFEIVNDTKDGDTVVNYDLNKTKPVTPCKKYFRRLPSLGSVQDLLQAYSGDRVVG